MFRDYFEKKQKELLKKKQVSSKSQAKTKSKSTKSKASKTTAPASYDVKNFEKLMENLLPQGLKLENSSPVDASGYIPENIDYIVYHEKWPALKEMMNGCIPAELVYATCHVEKKLTKGSLENLLNNVLLAKKLNRFTEEISQAYMIPSFLIVYESSLDLPGIKDSITDFYIDRSVDSLLEFDVMLVVNKGIIIKDWREKRKFVALETGRDSLMWFFILMNEYLEMDEQREVELRNYVHQKERYEEY